MARRSTRAKAKAHGPTVIERTLGKQPLKRYMGERPITWVIKAAAGAFKKPAAKTSRKRRG